ncbi:MAG: pyridoxal-phosphate dependent enzyme [Ignavibacteriaceae bacterium]
MKTPDKLSLANIPTPVQTINFNGNKFLIKRDDLTGVEVSGNKVRKLEYLLYQAKKEKADFVFTTGGEQSNHARATAVCAAILGIKSKLFLWGSDSAVPDGNLFLNKFIGAKISFLNRKDFAAVNEIMSGQRREYLSRGKNVYVIPEGGSTTLGIWGYINFIKELESQVPLSRLSGILAASGSGGTAAGLLAGVSLLNLKTKVYAVNVLYSKEEIRKKILNLAEGCILDYKLPCALREDQLEIIDGYSSEGYKNINADKLKLIKKFAQSSGIILDPAYTGKAFAAYYDLFLSKGKGMKVLFVHTGGLFGVFSKKEQYLNA